MKKKIINVCLLGNPNTGKTSLLNTLAGLSLHVGNWPGKTVEKKDAKIKYKDYQINLVDLPGSYSITPYSEEEKVSHEFLLNNNPDVIVQTIDVNALERNLLMTMELLALGKKVLLAFNFNKEAKKRGVVIDTNKISTVLELPVVSIEANTGENKDKLLEEIVHTAGKKATPPSYLAGLMKNQQEIHHNQAIRFF